MKLLQREYVIERGEIIAENTVGADAAAET